MRSNASTARGRCRSRGPDLGCGRDRCVGRSSAAARPPVPGFPCVPVPVGRPPWIERRGRGGRRGCVPGRGNALAVGACRDLVGGAGPVVAGGDDAAYQLRGVVAGAAAHDVRAVWLLGVFVVAFGGRSAHTGRRCWRRGRARWTRRCSTMRAPPKDTITQLAVCSLRRADRYRPRGFRHIRVGRRS